MAVVMGERLLVLVFVTSLLVWAPASGEGASDEEAPGTVAHVQETVEKREVLVESKAEEETEQLPTASSEQTENSNHEEITKGEGEVTEEHDVVMSTHHPGDLEPLIEPSLATPPGDETTPTNLEVTLFQRRMQNWSNQLRLSVPRLRPRPLGRGVKRGREVGRRETMSRHSQSSLRGRGWSRTQLRD